MLRIMFRWLVFVLSSVATAWASDSVFTRLQSVESPIDFHTLDQDRILFFSEKRRGIEIHQLFPFLRTFAEKQLFGSESGVLVPLNQFNVLSFKSVFKVNQSFSKLTEARMSNPAIQNQLFSPIEFKNCGNFKCSAQQRVDAFQFHVDVKYQTYYRFLKINHPLELQNLGLSGTEFQNSTEFPKYILIQVGKNWSNFFEDTVSVTFFERHPQRDEVILAQSYQILVLSLLGSIPQAQKVISTTIQMQVLHFIHRMEGL